MFDSVLRRVDKLKLAFLWQLPSTRDNILQHVEIAGDDRQQIVEIMSDAAGQLPDCLEFLCMPENFFRSAAIDALNLDQAIRFTERARPLSDLRLEGLVQPPQFLLCLMHAEKRFDNGNELIGFYGLDQVRIGAAIEGC